MILDVQTAINNDVPNDGYFSHKEDLRRRERKQICVLVSDCHLNYISWVLVYRLNDSIKSREPYSSLSRRIPVRGTRASDVEPQKNPQLCQGTWL